ncbi:MAG: SgcJ/EcaC family oxidoreductase [Myxococcota bacterium]
MRVARPWCIAAVLLAAPVFAQEEKSPQAKMSKAQQAEVDAIRARAKQYEQAWNAGDPAKMAEHFVQDATLIDPAGEQAKGRKDIERHFAKEHQQTMKGTKLTLNVTTVRLLPSDLALVDAEETIQGMKPEGRPVGEQKLHVVALLQKKGKLWQALDVRSYQYVQPSQMGVGGAGEVEPSPMEEEKSPIEPMQQRIK